MADIGGARLILDANVCNYLDEINGTLTVDGMRWYSDHPEGMMDLGKASLDFDLEPSADDSPVVEATLTIDEATLLNGKSEPIIALDRKTLKPISGSFDLKQRKGEFAWQWPVQKGVILDVIGYVDLSKRQASGSLRAVCEGFHLDEEQAVARILADAAGMAIDGSFSLKGDLNWAHGHLTPRITILSSDAAVMGTGYEVMAEGIEGPVTLTNLLPLSTPGNQLLRIKTLKLGKFEFHNGLIAFRIEDDPKGVFIERAEWGWLGGRLYAHAVRIDPNQPDIDLRLFAEGLDVGLLLRMAFGEGTIGEGKLYGTIPVRISTSDMADFSLGEGFLHSTTAQGRWKLEDRASDSAVWKALEQQFGQAMEATKQTGNRERILKGLLDFEYDKFKIDFIEQDDGLTARISMKGRSGNIEFEEIVVIIPGIDEDLRSIIAVKSVIGESLRRAVEKVK